MATNLNIDMELLENIIKTGHFKTKKSAVNTALMEWFQKHKQREFTEHFGTIEFHDDYDYKQLRSTR